MINIIWTQMKKGVSMSLALDPDRKSCIQMLGEFWGMGLLWSMEAI